MCLFKECLKVSDNRDGIFGLFSSSPKPKRSVKKDEPVKKVTPPPPSVAPAPTPNPPPATNILPSGGLIPFSPNMTQAEVEQVFAKMSQMRDELEDKLEDVIAKSGFTREEITQYFNDPKKCPPIEWDRLQRKKEDLEEKLFGKKHTVIKKQKQLTKDTKNRKSKTQGARKKWIPMK